MPAVELADGNTVEVNEADVLRISTMCEPTLDPATGRVFDAAFNERTHHA